MTLIDSQGPPTLTAYQFLPLFKYVELLNRFMYRCSGLRFMITNSTTLLLRDPPSGLQAGSSADLGEVMRGSYLLCLCFILKLQLGEPAHTITHRARTKARVCSRKTFQMTDKLEGESTEFQEENSSRRREPTAVKRPKNDKPRRVTLPRSSFNSQTS